MYLLVLVKTFLSQYFVFLLQITKGDLQLFQVHSSLTNVLFDLKAIAIKLWKTFNLPFSKNVIIFDVTEEEQMMKKNNHFNFDWNPFLTKSHSIKLFADIVIPEISLR